MITNKEKNEGEKMKRNKEDNAFWLVPAAVLRRLSTDLSVVASQAGQRALSWATQEASSGENNLN